MDARIVCGQRIGSEPVGSAGPPQAERLDKAPDAEDDSDKPEEESQDTHPTRDFRKQDGKNVEGDNPSAAFVAVVQPLDRGRSVDPLADGE